MSAGILSTAQVKELIKSKKDGKARLHRPSGLPLDPLLSESAIDIPLGDQYWEMQGSCRTGQIDKVTDLIRKYATSPTPQPLGTVPVTLKKQTVYLFKADCELDLEKLGLHQGRATGKSSVGRLDVLVRLLVGKSDAFDFVKGGSKHELYVEVTPISFDLQVKQGTTLSQLRLYKGKEEDISLTMEELYNEDDDNFPVVDEDGQPYRQPCADRPKDIWFPFRLDLAPDPIAKCSAFRARKDNTLPPIDPDQKGPDKKGFYDPKTYWEEIPSKNGAIILEMDYLYILRSKERLRIPAHLALECKSYTTEMGEWRIEYAGFAHPFFGRSRANGTPIIFEVRGHNVRTILTHEIPLGNVRFLRMSEKAKKPKEETAYEKQELALSKCFKRWDAT
jgi:dCTP deaminase